MAPAMKEGPSHREEAALNLMHYITHGHRDEEVLQEMRDTVDHIVAAACERVADRLLQVAVPLPIPPLVGHVQNLVVQALRGDP